jgi:hypothetical protein
LLHGLEHRTIVTNEAYKTLDDVLVEFKDKEVRVTIEEIE